jgi:5-methylcytosine-specific restriction protein A
MELISSRSELEQNLSQFRKYLMGSGIEAEFARDLIEQGICFVIAEAETGLVFAPSRFVGYRANDRHSHLQNVSKDGRDTNRAIADVVGFAPEPNAELEREYHEFCGMVKAAPRPAAFNSKRKFWDLRRSHPSAG